MATHRFAFLTVAIATVSLALAACGGGDPDVSSAGSERGAARDAALDFAKCMRENGVDMPDPTEGGGIRLQAGPDSGNDPATLEKAQEACGKHLEKVRPPELSEEQEREFKERALKFARCMREQGIDMPDPTFGGAGRVQQRLERGVDPEDPRFQDASRECSKYRPGMRTEGGS